MRDRLPTRSGALSNSAPPTSGRSVGSSKRSFIVAVQSLAGLAVYGGRPERLLGFYRDRLGIPLALTTHGSVREHYEAAIGETHVALLPGRPRLVPSFRVADLAAALAGAEGG